LIGGAMGIACGLSVNPQEVIGTLTISGFFIGIILTFITSMILPCDLDREIYSSK
jgi:hypothetical protein